MKTVNYVNDMQFHGNVLVAGIAGCGKTYFIQKLVVKNFFGESRMGTVYST